MPNQYRKRSRAEFEAPSYDFPKDIDPHYVKKCADNNINPYYAIHMQTAKKMGHILGHTQPNAILPETMTELKLRKSPECNLLSWELDSQRNRHLLTGM